MNEYPLFVPFEEEHLAAVVTVPDEPALGLVLLLTGTGAPRSHRFQLWTRTARALVEHGLASIRMDYRGIGDSTGRLLQPVLGDRRLDQAVRVAQAGMEIAGTRRLAVVGNCSGAIVALGVAAQVPECEAAICILPRLVQLGGVNRAAMEARKSRLAGFLRRSGILRRVVTGTLSGTKDVPSEPVRRSFEPALAHAQVLFVYSHDDPDPYVGKSRRLLQRMAAKLPPEERARLEMIFDSDGPLAGFESHSVQDMTIRLVVDWLRDRFSPPSLMAGARPGTGRHGQEDLLDP